MTVEFWSQEEEKCAAVVDESSGAGQGELVD